MMKRTFLIAFTLLFANPVYASYLGNDASRLNKGTVASGLLPTLSTTVNGKTCTIGSTCKVGSYLQCSDASVHTNPVDTTEDILASCQIPANAVPANGCIVIDALWDYTSSSNIKNLRVRAHTSIAVGGTIYLGAAPTTTLALHSNNKICNANATNAQIGGQHSGGTAAAAVALDTSAIDTTSAWYIVITGQKASSGETLNLDEFTVTIAPF